MTGKTCFVIAPIGEPESDTQKRSDQVIRHIVCPAVSECGYTAVRADQISEPGMITSQVIQHIVDDPLVVADLTERNPNVFYELAIRHAIRKPLVQMIKKGEQIPFDVAGTRTIHVDHRDLDSVENAKKEFASQIRTIEKDSSKLESPISVSLDLQLLKQSDNPEQRSLGDVLSVVSELRSSMAALEKRLSTSESPASVSIALRERDLLLATLRDREISRDTTVARVREAAKELRVVLGAIAGGAEKLSGRDERMARGDIVARLDRLVHMLMEV